MALNEPPTQNCQIKIVPCKEYQVKQIMIMTKTPAHVAL